MEQHEPRPAGADGDPGFDGAGEAASERAADVAADGLDEGPAAAEDAADPLARLAEVEAEAARFRDEYLRALAEIENVRRRAARDRSDASKYAVTGFARDILAVADNLRRAVDSIDPEMRSKDPTLEALIAGVEMTEKALLGAFERHGITPIEAEGKRFDPHVHEAMFEIPDESVPHGTVLQVLERGYMIHDRPLRPARVGVSRGGPRTEAAPSEAPAAGDPESNVEPFPGDPTSSYGAQEGPPQASGSRLDEKL